MLQFNIYLVILLAILSSCVFFGVDSILFIASLRSMTKEVAIFGFVISAVMLMFGVFSYLLSVPRKKYYRVKEVVPWKTCCEISAFQAIEDTL